MNTCLTKKYKSDGSLSMCELSVCVKRYYVFLKVTSKKVDIVRCF
jgi:hypothetical protein